MFGLLNACQKYDMVLIQLYIRDEVKRGTFPAPTKAQASRAYVMASSLGLVPEMEHAAQLTMDEPMTFESLGEDLRLFSGQVLRELIRYRAANRRRQPKSLEPTNHSYNVLNFF